MQGTVLVIGGIASEAWCVDVVRADPVCVPTPKAHSREARIGAEAAGVPLCSEVVCKEPTANQHEHMVLTHLQ